MRAIGLLVVYFIVLPLVAVGSALAGMIVVTAAMVRVLKEGLTPAAKAKGARVSKPEASNGGGLPGALHSEGPVMPAGRRPI